MSQEDRKTMRNKTREKGMVLVVVLWMVVVLILISASMGRDSRMDMRLSLTRIEKVRCKWACRAGLERAIGVLNEDTRASDSLSDYWSDNDEDFNSISLKQCYFSVRCQDEASKLNINTATKEQLMSLPYITQDVVEAIVDWRDENDTSGAGGAEGGYYLNLPYPYNIRNGPLKTIRELLLVKGVESDLFFGEDTNFNNKLDYNERDGQVSPPFDNADDKLDKGWIAFLTCYSYDTNKDSVGSDRVNINEADKEELQESLGIKESYAKWIVDNRNNDFKSIADLINEKSPKKAKKSNDDSDQAEPLDLQTFKQIADKITIDEDDKIVGRVNINTAPREVLAALLGGDTGAEQLADQIIAHRGNLLYGMESIAEALNVESMKISNFKKIANYITTRSNVYTVRSIALADRGGYRGFTLRSEAVVDRSERPSKVLYWYQGTSY
jgi:type II secretory pathway component PulK